MPVRRQLHPIRQPAAKIVHQHQGEFGIATADQDTDQHFVVGIDRRPGPAIADRRVPGALLLGAFFALA